MVRESARPGWFDSAADLDQFGTRNEFRTDGLVKLVRALGLRVAPGKVTADLGIVATVVDDADVVAQKGTAPAAHPGARRALCLSARQRLHRPRPWLLSQGLPL